MERGEEGENNTQELSIALCRLLIERQVYDRVVNVGSCNGGFTLGQLGEHLQAEGLGLLPGDELRREWTYHKVVCALQTDDLRENNAILAEVLEGRLRDNVTECGTMFDPEDVADFRARIKEFRCRIPMAYLRYPDYREARQVALSRRARLN